VYATRREIRDNSQDILEMISKWLNIENFTR